MKLVLQCAMCGTHHPVGTAICSACRASGVTQLRLMFECPTCGGLGLNPVCGVCPPYEVVEPEDLIIAEELPEESLPAAADDDFTFLDFDLGLSDDEVLDADSILDLGDNEDEAVVVDHTEDESEVDSDEGD